MNAPARDPAVPSVPASAATFPVHRYALLGDPRVCHAVAGRADGPRQDYNLSFAVGDPPEVVRANRARLADQLGIAPEAMVCARQVHGAAVALVGWSDRSRGVFERDSALADVDGLMTDQVGVYLFQAFADCVPLLFFDPGRPAVALAHAGWRGTARSIARRTVAAMVEAFGSDPAALRVVVGPSIGGCCYEVSDAVAAEVQATADESVTTAGPRGRPHLDLGRANRRQLLAAGLRAENLLVSGPCTSCAVDRFFSHRAEHGRAGRFGVVLGLRP